jgi:hypothetical protein
MLNHRAVTFRARSAAICAALGVASALALGGAMVGPSVAEAASGYTGTCTETIAPGTNPATTASAMSAGQVLCLNSGKYQSITQSSANMFNASGTSGNPIIITSAPGQTATIQGADYVNGNYITFENLNLDIADVLGTNNGSDFAGCPSTTSEGMEINGSYVTLQDDNIYESVNRANLIGIGWNASTSNPVTGDVIRNNNIGPAGSCKQLDHLIYDDYSSGLQITGNWFFDDPYGYGVQFYQGPSNTTMTGNVLDNVVDGIIAASTGTGDVIEHNVAINLPNVSGEDSGMFVNCYQSGATTVQNDAIYNAANGFGSECGSLNIAGTNPTLTANPFVGGKNSDNYTLASNSAAATVAGYGLWNGQGPPSPNPAIAYTGAPTTPTTSVTQPTTPAALATPVTLPIVPVTHKKVTSGGSAAGGGVHHKHHKHHKRDKAKHHKKNHKKHTARHHHKHHRATHHHHHHATS